MERMNRSTYRNDLAPQVKREREAWELCKYNEIIPERLLNFIESSRLNGEPESCATVILELLEIGPQFYLDIHAFVPVLTGEAKERFTNYKIMSDNDLRRHLLLRFLAYKLFNYDGDEETRKDLLDMVMLQKMDEEEDGSWSVIVNFNRWMENWNKSFSSILRIE